MPKSWRMIFGVLMITLSLAGCDGDEDNLETMLFQGTQTLSFSGETSNFALELHMSESRVESGRVTTPIDPNNLIPIIDGARSSSRITFTARDQYTWTYEVDLTRNVVTGLFRTNDISDHNGFFRAERR